ncbi:hypothetical protein C3L33_01711, partial [Rhododendron williamsianum]
DETQAPMDPNAVSKAFVDHYYSTFDTNRPSLANLYQEASMLTFEGQPFQGAQNIAAKLASLPFQQCQHSVTTVDCQPSGSAGGMLVFVSGNLQLAGEQHALKFSQVFLPTPCLHIIGPLTEIDLFHLVVPEAVLDKQRSGSGELGVVEIIVTMIDMLLLVDIYQALIFSIYFFGQQLFHLMPTPQGSFYVQNDIFRLNYA